MADASDGWKPFDGLHESVRFGPIPVTEQSDGLPGLSPMQPTSDIVPLSPENLVCMPDTTTGRPVCRFYRRQLTQLSENPEARLLVRLCTARIGVAASGDSERGDFMMLTDTAMWACELREPRDRRSEELLDKFDTEKVAAGRSRVHLPMFAGIFEQATGDQVQEEEEGER